MITAVLFSLLLANDTRTGTIREIPIFVPTVSPNGEFVLGSSLVPGSGPCIWTARGGIKPLDLGLSGAPGAATAASADGKVVVGFVLRNKDYWVFLWKKEEGVTFICPNGINSQPGVSGDGQHVFGVTGTKTDNGFREEPFAWSSKDGLRRLQPIKQGETYGGVLASSFDGSTVVGYSDVGPKDPEFRKTHFGSLYIEDGSIEGAVWINGNRPIELGRPEGFFTTQVTGCSSDGKIVCGFGATKQGDRPFTWSKGTGLVLLPMPSENGSGEAYFITSDGKTVFGSGSDDSALVWRADFRVAKFADFLRKNGVDSKGWKLRSVTGISDDGRVIAGGGRNPSGESCYWVVTLPS